MRTTVLITLTVTLLALTSCQPEEKNTQKQPAPAPQKTPDTPDHPMSNISSSHTVVTQEVIQSDSYTYLNVEENNVPFWIAINKTEMTPGEIFSFTGGLEMRNFKSKELQRTFDVIYFVGAINKDAPPADPPSIFGPKIPLDHSAMDPHQGKPAGHPATDPHQKKPAVDLSSISVEPAAGGISIGELFSSKDSYSGKTIRIRGKVTKVNLGIMGKNWIHLQDGTGGPGTNDLLLTTETQVAVGDVVTYEGTIVLNKDFGSGYKYDLLMEKAKLINE